MRKTGRQAAAKMRQWSLEGRTGVVGYCLKVCREAWDLPADEPSALQEWRSIPPEHRFTDWRAAPVGAPHFWTGKRGLLRIHGHIALQAAEPGWVWSTDAPERDRIGRVPLSWFRTRWGAIYLGYSDQLQNRTLPLKTQKATDDPADE